MERSGSQKALLVLSILNIIGAVFVLILGVALAVGGAAIGTIDSSEAAAALEGTGVTQGEAGIIASMAGVVFIFSGVIELIMGILGVRASKDNQKIMPVWVFAIISLVMNIASLISVIASGGFGSEGASSITAVILSALMMWVANNVKKEAGK